MVVVAVVEKSVVATVVACVSVSVSVFGAGGRRSSCRVSCSAGRQAEPKQAASSEQQASESAPGSEWIEGIKSFGWWYNRVCLCGEAAYVQVSTTLCHSCILFDLSIAFSPNLSIFLPSHTHLTRTQSPHTHGASGFGWTGDWRCAGSKAQARGSRLARPRSELCTRQSTTQTLSASCSAFRSPKGLDNHALLNAAVLPA